MGAVLTEGDMKETIGIRDVAEACGVSIGTVSKALNRSERIGDETAERIRRVAREMGYIGSGAARALSGRRRRVSILLPEEDTWETVRYARAAERVLPALPAFGMEGELIRLPAGRNAPFSGREKPDALILPSSVIGRAGEIATEIPSVLLHARSSLISPVAETVPDYRVAGRLAAQFSAFATTGGGCAILISRRGTYAGEEMIRGFREISARLALPFAGVAECGESSRQTALEIRRLGEETARLRTLFVASPLIPAVLATMAETKKKYTVIGTDFSSPATEALRAGQVAALLYTAPERQMEEAVRALRGWLFGGKAAGLIPVRPELVLRSNLECYQ